MNSTIKPPRTNKLKKAGQGCRADIVMVAYNRKNLVFNALKQLSASSTVKNVIVVDNASADDLYEEGIRRFPQIEWMKMDSNIGCRAWNFGIARACSDLVLILDDDCLPDFDSLERAVRNMAADDTIGLTAFNVKNHFSGISEWRQLEHVDGTRCWANAIGACMLVRRSYFISVGGYRDYFLCFNDLDLVFAIWEAGYRVIYDPSLEAWHYQRREGPKNRRPYFEVRNLLWTLKGRFPVAMVVVVMIKFLAGMLWDIRKNRDWRDVIRGLSAGLKFPPRIHSNKRAVSIPSKVRRLFYRNFLMGGRWQSVRPECDQDML